MRELQEGMRRATDAASGDRSGSALVGEELPSLRVPNVDSAGTADAIGDPVRYS